MTLTAMRPEVGLSKGREVSLWPRVDAVQMAHCAERVNATVVVRRRRPWAVAVVKVAIRRVVGVRPNEFSVGGVETQNSLDFLRFLLPVHRVDIAAVSQGEREAGSLEPIIVVIAYLRTRNGKIGQVPRCNNGEIGPDIDRDIRRVSIQRSVRIGNANECRRRQAQSPRRINL